MTGTAHKFSTDVSDKIKFQKKVSKMKRSFTHRIVTKMQGDKLTPEERDKPAAKVAPASKRGKAWEVTDKVGHYSHKGSEYVDDTLGNGLDSLASLMDYADGGSKRKWSMVGNSDHKSKWGDGSLQSEGVPIVGATIKAIKLLLDAGSYIKKIVEFVKNSRHGNSTTTEEKFDFLKDTLEMFMSCVDTANSIMGTFTTFLGQLPIAGAVIGTISSCISFGANMTTLIKSGKSIRRMRKQKKAAKDSIAANNKSYIQTEKRKALLGIKRSDKTTVKSSFENVIDEGASERRGKIITRSMRLDEKTKEMRTKHTLASAMTKDSEKAKKEALQKEDENIRDLEDYDVTKELTSANKKRARQGLTDIVFKDAAGIATSLATLDPTGMGAGIGAAISAIVGVGYLTKDVVVKGRQVARNSGRFGADVNKSDANKKQRRHNLAVIMYDRLNELKEKHAPNLTDDPKNTAAQASLAAFTTMEERITALGVAGPLFRAAADHSEMLKVMRKGFYREND